MSRGKVRKVRSDRRERLGNGYIGALARPDGFALREGLAAPGALPLPEALALVGQEYDRQVAAGTVKQRTVSQYERRAREFVLFAEMLGAVEVRDATEETVDRYCWARNAPGARRQGEEPRPDTRTARRSGIRAFSQTLALLGLDDRRLGWAVPLPGRGEQESRHDPDDDATHGAALRPLSDRELGTVRWSCRNANGDSRLPAAVALAAAGAGTGQLPHVKVGHLFLDQAVVWVPPVGRARGRWLELDEWAVLALRRHVRRLAGQVPADRLAQEAVVSSLPTRRRANPARPALDPANSAQSVMTGLLRRALRLAGLAGKPGLRPGSFPLHAAALAFRRTGRIEAAAVVLGVSDLNAVAVTLEHGWRTPHALAPDPVLDAHGFPEPGTVPDRSRTPDDATPPTTDNDAALDSTTDTETQEDPAA